MAAVERLRDLAFSILARVIAAEQPPWTRYGSAVAVTLVVAGLKIAEPALWKPGPDLFLTIPVAASALLFGAGPGLVATVGTTLVVAYLEAPQLELRIVPTRDVVEIVGFLFEGLVITALGAGLRRSLNAARSDLYRIEEAERQRSALLAVIGHEIRNPLTSLSGNLQLARHYVKASEEHERLPRVLGAAEDQVSRLVRLVDDLSLLSTASRAGLTVRTGSVDLRDVAAAAAERAIASLEGTRRVSISLGAEPVVVSGDRERVDQIVDNLIRNAIRYTPAGTPIEIEVTRDASDRHMALLRVRDRGHGIAPDERETIFAPFVRGATSRGSTGSGLGLYIARELAERMAGRLRLESSTSQGSVFALALPTTALAPEASREREEALT
ncbi:MAG: HAMP domain-containing histidine kinase [Chloroflexota bacterium]|nr:HAMP domain-containing histidine kinase [Chloroflexota bacterium]